MGPYLVQHHLWAVVVVWQRQLSPSSVYMLSVNSLHAGYKPFQGVSYEGIAAAVIQHAMADLPPHLSPAFKSFMASALTYDPQQRPSAMQLLDHPWVQVRMVLRLQGLLCVCLKDLDAGTAGSTRHRVEQC